MAHTMPTNLISNHRIVSTNFKCCGNAVGLVILIKASDTRDLLQRFLWSVFEHLSYREDLSTRRLHLYWPLKKHLLGLHFQTDAEVQNAIVKSVRDYGPDFSNASFDRLVYRWNKCYGANRSYFEQESAPNQYLAMSV